ncbi:hypothetical protein [Wolbachia endosymbiont (group A) of Clivina fossor]
MNLSYILFVFPITKFGISWSLLLLKLVRSHNIARSSVSAGKYLK